MFHLASGATAVVPDRRRAGRERLFRPDLARRPVVAIWELTRACDLCCLHCRATAVPARDPGELTTVEALAVIDQLVELDPGVVVLTGGDPLKRPDLVPLVEKAVGCGLAVALAPSVTPLLTAGAIARLVRAGVGRIALSLDGPDAAIHDALRGAPGAFAATLRAIDAVRAAGVPLQINTSLGPRTADAAADTAALVAAVAPALWSVFFVVPTGRAAAGGQLAAARCEELFQLLYDWRDATGLEVKTTAAPAFRRVVSMRDVARRRAGECVRRRRPLPVNDGKGIVFISHTGEIFPSGFLPLAAGEVRTERLVAVYRRGRLFRALRATDRLEGKCGVCPFRFVCGGSRARAYATTSNFLAEDPACAYVPPVFVRA